ncbi:hypothetical protein SCALM49S_07439 [Streptomyces californicus]
MASLISASRSSTMRSAFSRTARLLYGLVSAHACWARSAARYAWSTSPAVATGIEASFSPSNGLKSMMSQDPFPGLHSPSMYWWARSVKKDMRSLTAEWRAAECASYYLFLNRVAAARKPLRVPGNSARKRPPPPDRSTGGGRSVVSVRINSSWRGAASPSA